MQYHPRGREVFAPPILGLRLRDIGILGQGPCAGSMQYCNKNTCFACLKYWNTAPQHLRYWDTGNTVKYSNSPCLLRTRVALDRFTPRRGWICGFPRAARLGHVSPAMCRGQTQVDAPWAGIASYLHKRNYTSPGIYTGREACAEYKVDPPSPG